MATPPQFVPTSTASLEIDTLPVLYALLSRLQPPASSGAAGSPPAATPSINTPSTLDPTAPLRAKDVPIATEGIRNKLKKARKEVKEFPDVERTIAEQEEEIKELEEKIRKQRQVLKDLAEMSGTTRIEKGR
jgi:hypothetical protein